MAGESVTIYRDASRGLGTDTVVIEATDAAGKKIQKAVDVIVSAMSATYAQTYQLKDGDVGPLAIGKVDGVGGVIPYSYGATP